jgi:hypothetical protein
MLIRPLRSAFLAELAKLADRLDAFMVSTFKWDGTYTDRSASTGGTIGAELNSLANNAFSTLSGIYDNATNLDQWAAMQFDLASLSPTAGANIQLFMAQSLDGTNYEDAPSSTNPGSQKLAAWVSVGTGAATKREMTQLFRIPPGKWKWSVKQSTGVAFPASGNTGKLFTANERAT